MPEGFDQCRANGGKIRTISGPDKQFGLKAGEYCHVCIDKEGLHRGEVKRNQSPMKMAKASRMSEK